MSDIRTLDDRGIRGRPRGYRNRANAWCALYGYKLAPHCGRPCAGCGSGLGFPVPAPRERLQGGVAGSGIAVSGRAVFVVVVG